MTYECDAPCPNSEGGVCKPAKHFRSRVHMMHCTMGRAYHIITNYLMDFGHWKIFEYADGTVRMTLYGRTGRVEVWGGDHHAREVWYIERGGKREVQVCEDWHVCDGTLVDAVSRACAMAEVQTRMEVVA